MVQAADESGKNGGGGVVIPIPVPNKINVVWPDHDGPTVVRNIVPGHNAQAGGRALWFHGDDSDRRTLALLWLSRHRTGESHQQDDSSEQE